MYLLIIIFETASFSGCNSVENFLGKLMLGVLINFNWKLCTLLDHGKSFAEYFW